MTGDAGRRPPASPAPPAGPGPARPDLPILDQAFDADSLYALRAAVAAHATQAGLTPGRAGDLVIAVHELAANAIRHGAHLAKHLHEAGLADRFTLADTPASAVTSVP
jgi:Histidine kinase-like ATPase domain